MFPTISTMLMFSDATNTHNYYTRCNPILNHPTSNLFGREKYVRYHLPRVIEETDPNVIERWKCIVIMGSVNADNLYTKLQIRMQPAKLLFVSKLRMVIDL